MGKQSGIAARVYSINQPKLDEALQSSVDMILDVASKKKLADIKEQIEAKLKVLDKGKEEEGQVSTPLEEPFDKIEKLKVPDKGT